MNKITCEKINEDRPLNQFELRNMTLDFLKKAHIEITGAGMIASLLDDKKINEKILKIERKVFLMIEELMVKK